MKIFIAIVSVLCFCFVGCDKKEPPPKETKKAHQITADKIRIDGEKALLLAMKYKIDSNIVLKILKEYEAASENMFIQEFKSESPPWETKFKPLIIELSKKYDIPEDKFASLVIDYKMWDSCDEASSK